MSFDPNSPYPEIYGWHLFQHNVVQPSLVIPDGYQIKSNDGVGTIEMSKDQVNILLLGLAFVKMCVPETAYYDDGSGPKYFMDNVTYFRTEASHIADRLWNTWKDDYCIENPVTNNPVVCCGDQTGCWPWNGGGIIGAEYGYACAIDFITGEGLDNYLSVAGQAVGLEAWGNSLEVIQGWDVLFDSDDPKFKYMILAAIGHSIYQMDGDIPLYNKTQQMICSGTTPPGIWGGYFDSPILPLIHAYFYDRELDCFQQSDYSGMLNKAPCEGPHNYGGYDDYDKTIPLTSDLPSWEWSSVRRWNKPEERGNTSYGEWNGLDYMILYNLYCLYYGFPVASVLTYEDPDWPHNLTFSDQIDYYNALNYVEQYDYPRQWTETPDVGDASWIFSIGTSDYPKTVSAFHTITTDKTIGAGGNLTYQYGDADGLIEIEPGFDVDAANGAVFNAYQHTLTCNTSTNEYEKNAGNRIYYPIAIRKFHHDNDDVSELGDLPTQLIAPVIDTATYSNYCKVFPNPAENSVTISVADNYKHSVQVSDVYGKVVRFTDFNGPAFKMDISDLAAGLYYLQVLSNSGGINGYVKLVVQ